MLWMSGMGLVVDEMQALYNEAAMHLYTLSERGDNTALQHVALPH